MFVRALRDLVREAAATDVTGWDFGWLEGCATVERPPPGCARRLAARLRDVSSALDLDRAGAPFGHLVALSAAYPTPPPALGEHSTALFARLEAKR